LNVYDHDTLTKDDLLGGTAIPLSGLLKDKPTTFDLPVLYRKAEHGSLKVTITSHGVSWTEIAAELRAQVEDFAAENAKYKKLNEELEGTVKTLHKEVAELTSQVDRFTTQNNRLEGEVNRLHDENNKLEETSKVLLLSILMEIY
jgi:predicted  nucleic acid-binding Zn-ribbon protein